MYSPNIVEKRLSAARRDGFRFRRLPREDSIGITAELEALRLDKQGKPLPDGNLTRALHKSEEDFIASERTICKCDFRYFLERYWHVELDPGVTPDGNSGIGAPVLLESQSRYISLWGKREEECYRELREHKFTMGIMSYLHKCRQVAATTTVRGANAHRMLFWPGTRSFCASLDEPRIGELYSRDKIGFEGLPFWLKPRMPGGKFAVDVKNAELGFDPPISSRMSYQTENQQQGIGVGSQNDFSHLTEVALWTYPYRINFSFLPGVPKAITTFHVQESTASGKGYWYEVTEAARHRRRGSEHWVYAFIPWWYNSRKHRMIAPAEWSPEEHTQKHAELVERTSPEFNDGVTYRCSRGQLYWWETERARHASIGELAEFLTNYPATPEQSFVGFAGAALPVELVESMEQEIHMPEGIYLPEMAA